MMHARISRIRKEDVCNLPFEIYRSMILIQPVCSRVFKLSSKFHSSIHLSIHLSIHPINPFIYPFYSSIHSFIQLSIYLFIYPSILPFRSFQKRNVFSDPTYNTFRLLSPIFTFACSKYLSSSVFSSFCSYFIFSRCYLSSLYAI